MDERASEQELLKLIDTLRADLGAAGILMVIYWRDEPDSDIEVLDMHVGPLTPGEVYSRMAASYATVGRTGLRMQ